jgi:uncharacterized membrane protein YphA (DoxX/SURF4 family)
VLADTSIKNAYVPLLLRLTLGAIVLAHGALKVWGEDNQWGAAWATTLWEKGGHAPKDVLAKIDRLGDRDSDVVKSTKDAMNKAYAADAPLASDALAWSIAQLAVAWGEVAAGLALLLGLLTRFAALGLIVIQAGAIATVTGARGFAISAGVAGYDYNVALLAMCLCLVLTGGGTLSLDHWLASRRKAAPGTPAQPAVASAPPPSTPAGV